MANSPADITSYGLDDIYKGWLNNLGVTAASGGLGELLAQVANFSAIEGSAGRQLAPTGSIAASMGRGAVGSQTIAVTSGTLGMTAIYLVKGMTITNINWVSGSTAAISPTNQWSGIYSGPAATPTLVAVTADKLTAAIAANTAITNVLSAPYTVTASGLYYVGILTAAGTAPTYAGSTAANAATSTIPPILSGTSNTGLTTPQTVGTVATTITATASMLYIYLT